MRSRELATGSIRYYRRFWRLIAIACAVAAGVIAGSLIVGDSVRHSLEKRTLDRLGDARTVIVSQNGYLDAAFAKAVPSGQGMLYSDGFVSADGRLIPVCVWGTDSVEPGSVKINTTLGREIGAGKGSTVVLRLPRNGLVPSGSLFVTEEYTLGLRLSCTDVLSASQGGNLSLRVAQVLPFNVFVSRSELCENLETGDKISMVFSSRELDQGILDSAFKPEYAGLSVRLAPDGRSELVSDAVFLQEDVIEAFRERDAKPDRLFSYLANSITCGDAFVPYSFVTAEDYYRGESIPEDQIYLSDYTAARLGARIGDAITVSYYISPGMKQLQTDSVTLRVGKIIPLDDILADPGLSASYPGLTEAQRCSDWDSDLPLDMSLISQSDELYWEHYRSAPKAILPYSAVASSWKNPYGAATALRLEGDADLELLSASPCGVSMIHPLESGLAAARGGVDFGGLFLALGCFIITAALLLILNPLKEMLQKRRGEMDVLESVGVKPAAIRKMLTREAAPVLGIASLAGVAAGLLYAFLVLFLLGNLWKGATHTDGFVVYPRPVTLIVGLLAGLALALITVILTLRRSMRGSRKAARQANPSRIKVWAIVCTALMILLPFLSKPLGAVVSFVLTGCLWVAAGTLWFCFYILKKPSNDVSRSGLVRESLYYSRSGAILSFITLSLGVFIVFAVGLNRQDYTDASKRTALTGGYGWWCETSVPVYYDLSTPQGRNHLSLGTLSPQAEILQFLRAEGDDASCLNLNKVETPAILAADMDVFLKDFPSGEITAEYMRSAPVALVDETVLLWGMAKQVGDTLRYSDSRGNPVDIVICGTLPNTVFQGNIVMDRSVFQRFWPQSTGSEVFLLRSPQQDDARIAATALNEYGIRVTPTLDRLKEFNSVTDAYLTIFLMLGFAGLLLGLVSFFVILRKNLAARKEDIEQWACLGIPKDTVRELLFKEYGPVPMLAVALGVSGALLSVIISFGNIPALIWILCIVFAACLLYGVYLSVKKVISKI